MYYSCKLFYFSLLFYDDCNARLSCQYCQTLAAYLMFFRQLNDDEFLEHSVYTLWAFRRSTTKTSTQRIITGTAIDFEPNLIHKCSTSFYTLQLIKNYSIAIVIIVITIFCHKHEIDYLC